VVKFYAAYCKACRTLAPKFLQVKDDPQLQNLPVVWAEFQISRNTKDLFRRLGVLTLPTIHFYDGSMLLLDQSTNTNRKNVDDDDNDDASVADATTTTTTTRTTDASSTIIHSNLIENFPCPPAKINLLKKKLARFINTRVDPETRQLTPPPPITTTTTTNDNDTATTTGVTTATVDDEQRSSSLDTTTMGGTITMSSFGEDSHSGDSAAASSQVDQPRRKRSIVIDNELITEEHLEYLRNGMPFFRDLTDEEFDTMIGQARLLTFNSGDVICKQGMPGTTFYVLKRGVVEMSVKSRFEDPIRTPPNYLGVVVGELRKFDYFGERALSTGEPLAASFRVVEKVRCFAFPADIIPESSILSKKRKATREMIEQLNQRYILPEDYVPPSYPYASTEDDRILELLVRFKQIRQAARCFSYIMQTEPRWNDPGTFLDKM
jgi:thiol-disulfide isomerase/thioredoxin